METIEDKCENPIPIRQYSFVLELKQKVYTSFIERFQIVSFEKRKKGKWHIKFIPLLSDQNILYMLDEFKLQKALFSINLKLAEDVNCKSFDVKFVDYTFDMTYEHDYALQICLIFQEIEQS